MTDITERLRSRQWQHQGDATHLALRDEAADEIDRLRAQLDEAAVEAVRLLGLADDSNRLRAALQGMLRWMPVYPASADSIVGGRQAHADAIKSARAALDEIR